MIFKKLLLSAAVLVLFTSTSWAAEVSAVKGNRVLIQTDGDAFFENDEFFLINPATQKKTAIIRVRQIKGRKALAEIIRGRADIGYTLEAKAPSGVTASPISSKETSETASASTAAPVRGEYLRQLKNSWGVMGGYLMNSMTANVTYKYLSVSRTTAASMSGTGFAATGFYDYVISPALVARMSAGIEQFNVTGSVSELACNNTTTCDAKINYLSFYGLGKYYVYDNNYRAWLGAGGGFLLAVSKSSSALNESQISTNQVFTLGAGVDIQRSRKNYIPISLEYNMFPSSETVKASMIMLKAGWAWNL